MVMFSLAGGLFSTAVLSRVLAALDGDVLSGSAARVGAAFGRFKSPALDIPVGLQWAAERSVEWANRLAECGISRERRARLMHDLNQ